MRSGTDTTGVSALSARHAVIDNRMTRTFNLQTSTQPNEYLMLKSIKIRGCRQSAGCAHSRFGYSCISKDPRAGRAEQSEDLSCWAVRGAFSGRDFPRAEEPRE